jgi:hypothetical protein
MGKIASRPGVKARLQIVGRSQYQVVAQRGGSLELNVLIGLSGNDLGSRECPSVRWIGSFSFVTNQRS